ncbi:hypothetical protein GBA65_13905 [Rubrobacter marinus]|uniref:Putative zinc-finger domain-containing protein n=1 Tax=Rubrobacter marinus TaxID=2653852 RepID=A0A6G8PYU6_9ACTN|nr:zf-HC2 domain-containing protein [Rubrobacter marinus]QIN79424.1 hypothetical protein GBA65_13905 [Rubrobacter marinus]
MSEHGPNPCGCDHEMVFELADGGLDGADAAPLRAHLERCAECRELYERELELNAYLSSARFPEPSSCSVHRGVAMALPTRPLSARLLWAALAATLLALAFVYLELNGAEPLIVAAGVLAAGWGLVLGSAGVAHTLLAAAGSTILLVLVVGGLADLLIALAFVSVHRRRRAREA